MHQVDTSAGSIRVCFVAENIVRITQTKGKGFADGVIVPPMPEVNGGIGVSVDAKGAIECVCDGKHVCLQGKTIRLQGELWEKPLTKFVVENGEPDVRIVKTVDGQRTFIQNLVEVPDQTAYGARLHLSFDKGEHIFGFGSHEEGVLDYRGRTQYLYQHNMKIPIPFFLSSNGYGILVDCGCNMVFNDDEHGSYLYLNAVEQLDCYVIFADSADGIVGGYRFLTGKAVLPPLWAFGYIQSKEHYRTQQELVDVAKEFRTRNIPIDCVVQDWNTWDEGMWGNKQLDKTRYPDFKAAVDELHRLNTAVIVSVWPNMQQGCENHKQFAKTGGLLNDYSTYNAFDEQARALYFKQLQEEFLPAGIDGLWCDSTEPFTAPDWGGEVLREPFERYELVAREHDKYLGPLKANLFAIEHAKGIYDRLLKETGKRVFNLSRAGYASLQQYGGILWSGDISATWDVLKKNIAEGINMAYSGMPYWHTDTGAFFAGGTNCWRKWKDDPDAAPVWFWKGDYDKGVDDEGYCELYVRWLQYSVFSSVCRSHGTDTPREPWRFTGEYYDAVVKLIRLRYQLLPYLYSLAAQVYFHDYTIVRSLLFDFPYDECAAYVSDAYLFGRALLVHPVTAPGVREESVYLPRCAGWYNFFTNEYHRGGQIVTVASALDMPPVFARAGSIVPLSGGTPQYAARCFDDIEIRLYTGADAIFTLYRDNGEDLSYQRGCYETVEFQYDEASGILTATRTGDESMFVDHAFELTVVTPNDVSTCVIHIGTQETVFVCLQPSPRS